MITRELQATLNLAANEAITRRHEFLTLEHLLFALLHDRQAGEIIVNCGGDLNALQRDLEQFFAETLHPLPDGVERFPEQTAAFERVLDRALFQAQSSGQEKIDAGNILASLYLENHSHALYLLEKQGITRLDLLNYISHGISKLDGLDDDEEEEDTLPSGEQEPATRQRKDPLEQFTTNLTARAALGKIDPLIGRDRELLFSCPEKGMPDFETIGSRRKILNGEGPCRVRHGIVGIVNRVTPVLHVGMEATLHRKHMPTFAQLNEIGGPIGL